MFWNYFKMAVRRIRKEKLYSGINIIGLAVSISVCLFIFQYAAFELSFDKFHNDYTNIYRLVSENRDGPDVVKTALSPQRLALSIKENFPEVIQTARLVSTRPWFDCTFEYSENGNTALFNERDLYFADASLTQIIEFSWINGQPMNALEKPFTAIITQSIARKYFGVENALGKTLHLKGSFDDNLYTITGVVGDLPAKSHLDANIFLSLASLRSNKYFASDYDVYTYIKIEKNGDIDALGKKINALAASTASLLNGKSNTRSRYDLQSISDIHLHSQLEDEMKPSGDASAVYFFILIALLILVLALINYVNLVTSRTVARAKEVGVRKVSGASRLQLMHQFLSESMVINLASIALAIIIVFVLSPYFFEVTGVSVHFENLFLGGSGFFSVIILFVFLIGIFLAGFLPARVIASFQPIVVLKGKVPGKRGGQGIRKALLVFQFASAIALTISVLFFSEQFRFLATRDLGIDIRKTMILKAPVMGDLSYPKRIDLFKAAIIQNPLVRSTASSSSIPGAKIRWTGTIAKGNTTSDLKFNVVVNVVDTDFIKGYGLRLIGGRNFQTTDFPKNKFGEKPEPVILNRAALEVLGFKNSDEAIETTVYWGDVKCFVVGVIENFSQSAKLKTGAMIFTANNGPQFSIKLATTTDVDLANVTDFIRLSYKKYFPESAFDYFFLEDYIAQQYSDDRIGKNLFLIFCSVAVLIAALGLFGLSTFAAAQRMKEVSLRKVFGARSASLIFLMANEFLLLIVVASFIAVPITYYGIGKWLDGFGEHIRMTEILFILPVLFIFVIAFFIVASQTLKTVRSNPATVLKND